MAATRITLPTRRHMTFDAVVGFEYLTRTGRLARLAKIEPCAVSGDSVLHFQYLGADRKPVKTPTERDGFVMSERVAARLMIRVA